MEPRPVRPAAADPYGRDATYPGAIPWPGWREILVRVYREFSNDRVLMVGAGTTFYLLLAVVPTLSAAVSIYGLFADPSGVAGHLSLVEGWMPAEGRQILSEQLTRLASRQDAGLGFALITSLALALWSSNAGMKALFEAMNVAYGESERRGFVKLTLISLGFTAAAIVLGLSLLTVLVGLPLVVDALRLSDTLAGVALRVASGLVLIIAAMAMLAALYRWGPSREEARWRWITPGAIVAVTVGAIASIGFSIYLAHFGRYNETYGSLGAIIAFMTWLWILTVLVVTGAELNAELEHQTARDSTTGAEAPLGARGARMADTVAQGAHDTDEGPPAAHAATPVERARSKPPPSRAPNAVGAIPATVMSGLVAAIAVVQLLQDLGRRRSGRGVLSCGPPRPGHRRAGRSGRSSTCRPRPPRHAR